MRATNDQTRLTSACRDSTASITAMTISAASYKTTSSGLTAASNRLSRANCQQVATAKMPQSKQERPCFDRPNPIFALEVIHPERCITRKLGRFSRISSFSSAPFIKKQLSTGGSRPVALMQVRLCYVRDLPSHGCL